MAESASSSSVVASLRALLTSLLQRAWTWVVRSTTQLQDSLVSLLLDFLSCLHAVQEHLLRTRHPHHRQHSVRIRGALSTELGVRSVVRCRRPQRPQLLTMAGIYQQYRVDKCHYQIIFTTPGSANDIQCACTVASNTSGSLGGAASYFPRSMPEDPTESSLRRESVVAFCRERSTWRRCAA